MADHLDLADRLRALHVPGDPLLLLNAWDAASARIAADAGLPAVATTSSGVARALGYDDGERTPVDEMLAAVARIVAAVPGVPVTADLEGGYGLAGEELARRLADTGAVGCNLEDSHHGAGGGLRDADEHAAYLAAVKDTAPHLVLNARVDVHLRGVGAPEERLALAVARAQRYVAAGADCVYPITVANEVELAAFAEESGVPVNAYWTRESPPPSRLAELRIARISVGGGLFAAAFQHTESLVARLKAGDPTALADD